jgi:hypothetical protein
MVHTKRALRLTALIIAIVVLFVVIFGAKVRAAFQHDHDQSPAANSERKALYWYDAMNPQHHYDKLGKAPDGMDLVPQYAEENGSAAANAAPLLSERKILYWYDPMHPRYKSD